MKMLLYFWTTLYMVWFYSMFLYKCSIMKCMMQRRQWIVHLCTNMKSIQCNKVKLWTNGQTPYHNQFSFCRQYTQGSKHVTHYSQHYAQLSSLSLLWKTRARLLWLGSCPGCRLSGIRSLSAQCHSKIAQQSPPGITSDSQLFST